MIATRRMNHFDLSEELKKIEQAGVQVPELQSSNLMPEYIRTEKDIEIYLHGGVEVSVAKGHVIDGHGNVVNLEALRQKQIEMFLNEKINYPHKTNNYGVLDNRQDPETNLPKPIETKNSSPNSTDYLVVDKSNIDDCCGKTLGKPKGNSNITTIPVDTGKRVNKRNDYILFNRD